MIDLKAIKEKAEASKQGNWVFEERPTYCAVVTDAYISGNTVCYSTNYNSKNKNPINYKTLIYIAAVSPDVVLKLLRIIEVQGEALKEVSCIKHGYAANDIARTALKQVSKILTEQNEGDG